MAEPVRLVTGIITDSDSRILLAQSSMHGWWELPGTKLDMQDETPELRLGQALFYKLGIDIWAPDTQTPHVLDVTAQSADVDFTAAIYRVVSWYGRPHERVGSGYRQIHWYYPSLHKLGRIGLSPIVEELLTVHREEIEQLTRS